MKLGKISQSSGYMSLETKFSTTILEFQAKKLLFSNHTLACSDFISQTHRPHSGKQHLPIQAEYSILACHPSITMNLKSIFILETKASWQELLQIICFCVKLVLQVNLSTMLFRVAIHGLTCFQFLLAQNKKFPDFSLTTKQFSLSRHPTHKNISLTGFPAKNLASEKQTLPPQVVPSTQPQTVVPLTESRLALHRLL